MSLIIALCSLDGGALQEPPDGPYLIFAPRLSFPPGSGFWKLRVICVERLVGTLCQQEANLRVVSESSEGHNAKITYRQAANGRNESIQFGKATEHSEVWADLN